MRSSLLLRGICLLVILALARFALGGNKPSNSSKTSGSSLSCTISVPSQVIDEQDTSTYYGNESCSGQTYPLPEANYDGYVGDLLPYGYSPILYSFPGWASVFSIASSQYVDGQSCGNNCLRATISSSYTTLNLDTTGTPRKITLDFTHPCSEFDCPTPAGSTTVFSNGKFTGAGLLNVFLESSVSGATFATMDVCSTGKALGGLYPYCPEARLSYAKFWFTDASGNNWRVDWYALRVLRMSAKTWYIIADQCDGTEVAGLSLLTGDRTRPKTVFNGWYKIPLLITAVSQ
jgi:hypothetical protein